MIYICERGYKERGDRLEEKTEEQKRGDCKQGSSRYVPSYSRNSYPCSILHYSLIILEYSIFADWCGR